MPNPDEAESLAQFEPVPDGVIERITAAVEQRLNLDVFKLTDAKRHGDVLTLTYELDLPEPEFIGWLDVANRRYNQSISD